MDRGGTDVSGTVGEGFPGERMLVLPRPQVRAALTHPPLRHLLVTDCGYFPHAAGHGRTRSSPIDQAVVLICARGKGWVRIGTGRFEVTGGQVAVLPPGLPHAYGADADEPWTLWWMHLAGDAIAGLCTAVHASPGAPVRVPRDPGGTALRAAEIVALMEKDSTDARLLEAGGVAWHLMTSLASSRTPRLDSEELVEQVAEYLRDTVGARVSIDDLAASVGLSSSHFAAVFRRRFGMPVHRYQVQLRMARAREIMDTTSLSIAHVAQDVGYDDPFYFTRQFRRLHGMSPTQYRAQQKG